MSVPGRVKVFTAGVLSGPRQAQGDDLERTQRELDGLVGDRTPGASTSRSSRSTARAPDTAKDGVSVPFACPPSDSYSRTITSPLRSSASFTASTTIAGLSTTTSGATGPAPRTTRAGRLVR